jgi:hypothetical protein
VTESECVLDISPTIPNGGDAEPSRNQTPKDLARLRREAANHVAATVYQFVVESWTMNATFAHNNSNGRVLQKEQSAETITAREKSDDVPRPFI